MHSSWLLSIFLRETIPLLALAAVSNSYVLPCYLHIRVIFLVLFSSYLNKYLKKLALYYSPYDIYDLKRWHWLFLNLWRLREEIGWSYLSHRTDFFAWKQNVFRFDLILLSGVALIHHWLNCLWSAHDRVLPEIIGNPYSIYLFIYLLPLQSTYILIIIFVT